MKTMINILVRPIVLAGILFGLCPSILFSQEIIKFKSGNQSEVKILYRTSDAVIYEMQNTPGIKYAVMKSQIDSIWEKPYPPEYLKQKAFLEKKLRRNQVGVALSGISTAVGVGLLFGGGITYASATPPEFPWFYIRPGTGAMVIGSIVTACSLPALIVRTVKLQHYKADLNSLKLRIDVNPVTPGVTLRVNF